MAAAVLLLALLAAPAVMADSSVMKQLSSSQFTGFMKLMEHADLLPEVEAHLKSGKGLTVFAPTDDALLYHTSPTLLAFLKLRENRATLRQVLLSHFVAEKLSPFQWEGTHKTLCGSDMPLSMDAQAFYANNVAVMQYNAVVGDDAAVHSIPSLIIPSSLAGNAQVFVEEGNEIRRILTDGAPAPAPAGLSAAPPAPANSAPARALASVFTVALALLAALVL